MDRLSTKPLRVGAPAALLLAIVLCLAGTGSGLAQDSVPVPQRRPSLPTESRPAKPSPGQKPAIPVAPPAWSAEEIAAARATCRLVLDHSGAEFQFRDAIRKGPCGAPAPIRLSRIGTNPGVTIEPPATLNCAMAAALARWLDQGVQPLARKMLSGPVVKISNIASYACRNRNNAATGRLSEHALANALDIAGFETANAIRVSLVRDWGSTARDRLAASTKHAAAKPKDQPPATTVGAIHTLETARLNLAAARLRLQAVEWSLKARGLADRARMAEKSLHRAAQARIDSGVSPERTVKARNTVGGAARDRTAGAAVAPAPIPVMNPGRTALERARREANRRLARAKRESERLEALARKRDRALKARARRVRQARASLTRHQAMAALARRRADDIARQADRAERRLAAALAARPKGGNTGVTAPRVATSPKRPAATNVVAFAPHDPPVLTKKGRFLRAAHAAACKVFGTVLGPEANAAHANHFHIDLAPRKRSAYCE